MLFFLLIGTQYWVSAQDDGRAIIVQNHYYPKTDNYEAVLQLRLRASEVRKKLGLNVGIVLENTDSKTGEPFVIWQAEYPSLQARDEDVAQLSTSEEFSEIQQKMGTLLARFERSVWYVHTSD